jgi:hypothetical protein
MKERLVEGLTQQDAAQGRFGGIRKCGKNRVFSDMASGVFNTATGASGTAPRFKIGNHRLTVSSS